MFYIAFLVCAYRHLQYFSSVYFTLLSLSLHVGICNVLVLYILLSFPSWGILASAVFQFCIFYFDFLVSGYWCLHYFGSVCFTLLSPSLHIGIHSISVLYFTLLASFLHIDICSISVPYILLLFPRVCILRSAVFQFCILLCLPRFCILTDIVFHFCILLYFPHLFILISTVFQLCIFYFAFFISAYCICSISVPYILLCFPRLCLLASAII